MSPLWQLNAGEMLAAFASGEATPVDIVQSCLDRLTQTEPQLNAVLALLDEPALRQAHESTARWAAGAARPLEGVPYGLKDIVATENIATTGGSTLYRNNTPTADATLAGRLSGAGGILLAKLHTFEFASGGAENRTFGRCHNPWDLTRTTGGSSSGSGAAVSSGGVPLAIGTDTGGSIRIPAAYCGITGLKPTYGRVPRTGVMGLSWTLDHAGPMTRSVDDAALMLQIIAGHDANDQTSSSRTVPDYTALPSADLRTVRFGRPRGWFEDNLSDDIADAFERSVAELEDLGITMVDVDLPDVPLWDAASWAVMYPEALSYHQHHVYDLENRDPMGAGLLADAPFIHAVDYIRSLRYRRIAQQQLQQAMVSVDALLTPSVCEPPPLLDAIAGTTGSADWLSTATRNSMPFNLTGSPALCVPGGLSLGLPTSLQLVGRPHDESTLLAIGSAYQTQTDHHLRRPHL